MCWINLNYIFLGEIDVLVYICYGCRWRKLSDLHGNKPECDFEQVWCDDFDGPDFYVFQQFIAFTFIIHHTSDSCRLLCASRYLLCTKKSNRELYKLVSLRIPSMEVFKYFKCFFLPCGEFCRHFIVLWIYVQTKNGRKTTFYTNYWCNKIFKRLKLLTIVKLYRIE